ncbi:hypothetical protein HUU05_03095 [candidate division KSB1 bacterium]|nr:hypothetical protein [candidate division KSB1 bacterium]
MIGWHRLFGLTLTDFFTDTGFHVELEKDLSLKQQFIDVIIIESATDKPMPETPDGLENLARFNLLTYKSLHEPLDAWALDELIGHYVNYRKQASSTAKIFLPHEDFQLYAVCTRAPEKLAKEADLRTLQSGVREIRWGSKHVRVIVTSQVPEAEHNAVWKLFSGIAEQVQHATANYRWRRSDNSGIINQLFQNYEIEGMNMPYTWDDYYRDITREHLDWLPKEELLAKLSVEDRLKGLPVEDRLKGLPVEDFLKSLPPEKIEAYLNKVRPKRRKSNGAARAHKKGRS